MNLIHDPNVNVLNPPADVNAVCITTNLQVKQNGRAVMGAGIALAANKKWRLDEALGEKLRRGEKHVVEIFSVRRGRGVPPLAIVAFPTKDDWRNKSSIELIKRGLVQLSQLSTRNGWETIWLPSLGTNNGGLAKTLVWPIMAKMLDNRFTLVLRNL